MSESLFLIMENMGISTFSPECIVQSDFCSVKGYNLAMDYSILWHEHRHNFICDFIALLSRPNWSPQTAKALPDQLPTNIDEKPPENGSLGLIKTMEDQLAPIFVLPFMTPGGPFGTISSSVLLYSYPSDEGTFYEKTYHKHTTITTTNPNYNDDDGGVDKEVKISFCLCKKE